LTTHDSRVDGGEVNVPHCSKAAARFNQTQRLASNGSFDDHGNTAETHMRSGHFLLVH
jgi:hypothetical protein